LYESFLSAGGCCKKEDILWNDSQDTKTQICRHLQQVNVSQGPSYSAVQRSHPHLVLRHERGTVISLCIKMYSNIITDLYSAFRSEDKEALDAVRED